MELNLKASSQQRKPLTQWKGNLENQVNPKRSRNAYNSVVKKKQLKNEQMT